MRLTWSNNRVIEAAVLVGLGGALLVFITQSVFVSVILVLILGIPAGMLYLNAPFIRSSMLVKRGRLEKAMKINKSIVEEENAEESEFATMAHLNLANIYHRQGKFEQSETQLEQIDREKGGRNIELFYNSLDALNKIMQQKDLDDARDRINQVMQQDYNADTFPIIAYLELLRGNRTEAENAIASYYDAEQDKRKNSVYFGKFTAQRDAAFQTMLATFFLGMYYYQREEWETAQTYLDTALSHNPYDNYYARKTEEVLEEVKQQRE